MNDNDILAIEEAAARLEHPAPDGESLARLHSAMATALTHGKAIRDIAHAAHLTALEVLDAADEITYPCPCLPTPGNGALNASPPPPPKNPLETTPDDEEPGGADNPRAWRKPRDGDLTWVSHRPSTESPARRYWLTHRATDTTSGQD